MSETTTTQQPPTKDERLTERFKALSKAAARGMFAALLGRLAAVIASGYSDWLQAQEIEDDEESSRLFAEHRKMCDEQEDIGHEFALLRDAQPEVAEEGWQETFETLYGNMRLDDEC